jgi:ABC-2 type transport system permease protein
MFTDITTIIWKEIREIFLVRGSMRGGLFNIAIILVMLGVFMPLQAGTDWLENPVLPLIWSWLPIFLAIGLVTDAFAGERERHTLETLLASRLPDTAILLGKIGAAVLYAWSISFVGMLIGAVTVNVSHPGQGLRFYHLDLFFGGLLLSFLAALLISSLGTLVSLNAATARQAYQRLGMAVMALWMVPTVGIQFLPDQFKQSISASLVGVNLQQVFFGILLVLTLADAIFLVAARARFQRAKLILE